MLVSSPRRRFTSVLDLAKPGGYQGVQFEVSEYKLGLLPLGHFGSLIETDIDQKHIGSHQRRSRTCPILTKFKLLASYFFD